MFNPMALRPGCGRFAGYEQALEESPIHQMSPFPVWHVMGYEACCQVLRDAEGFSNSPLKSFMIPEGELTRAERVAKLKPMMGETAEFVEDLVLMNDPPQHTRLRSLVSRAFAPAAMRKLTEQVESVANDLVDRVIAKESFELVEDFAIPLPIHIVAEILGVETDRMDDFKRWSDGFVSVPVQQALAGLSLPEAGNWREEFVEYFTEIIERRRREPRGDLISQLISLESEGEKVSFNELIAMCVLLIVAGNETSTNMISNAILALTQHPAEYEFLRDHREFIPSAIEEALRFYAPIQGFPRYAAKTTEVAGKRVSRGSMLMVWAGAANRDWNAFASPDIFDVTRNPNKHLAFGLGIHHCLGAGLARVEGKIALETLLDRLGILCPIPGKEPKFVQSTFLFGLSQYELTFDANAAAGRRARQAAQRAC